MEIQSIGVIGAGQMGNGIAHVMAVAGYDVVMTDISQEALDAAVARIGKNLGRQVSKGTLSAADQAAALARIRTTLETAEVAQTDLVIEAATERETRTPRRQRLWSLKAPAHAPSSASVAPLLPAALLARRARRGPRAPPSAGAPQRAPRRSETR